MKTDRSKLSLEDSQKVLDLLTNVSPEDKVNYMIFRDAENGVTLVSLEEGRLIRYPLGWKTASFIAYCLIHESILEASFNKVTEYLDNLSERRGEVKDWIKESYRWFSEFRNNA